MTHRTIRDIHTNKMNSVYGIDFTKDKLLTIVGVNNFKRPGSKHDTLRRQIRTFCRFCHVFGDYVHYTGHFDDDIELLNYNMEQISRECYNYITRKYHEIDKIRVAISIMKRNLNDCYDKMSLSFKENGNEALRIKQHNLRKRLLQIDPKSLQAMPDDNVLREFAVFTKC
jgi:hypothetical protein